MDKDCVVRLENVAVYHSDDPFSTLSRRRVESDGELVLSEVDFEVRRGEFVYFIGRVGTGKSSLLKTLYAEVPLLQGQGTVAGFDLRRIKRGRIPYLRRKVGIVFQDMQLLSDRNAFENLRYVLKATGWRRESEIERRIDEVLAMVGLEGKRFRMPFELSGGEKQRLVIARALLNSPELILADEPTGNLDPLTAESIVRLFHSIAGSGTAVIMSTHNTALIENYPSRTVLFSHGRIREVDMSGMTDAKQDAKS